MALTHFINILLIPNASVTNNQLLAELTLPPINSHCTAVVLNMVNMECIYAVFNSRLK